ncbi:MAG: hypothetical protein ACREON_08905, partial [Gemmatimonadaceae bacterium]
MTRRPLAACLALAAVSFACFSERQDVTGASGTGECRIPLDARVVGTVVVAIQNFTFLPADLRIRRGTTVTWVNCEPGGIDPHSSTSDGGVWDSGLIPPGGTYSRTFDVVGTFP